MYFSKSTLLFYDPAIHQSMPTDAVEIDKTVYTEMLRARTLGMRVGSDNNGYPIALEAIELRTAESLRALVTARRWTVETSGITLPTGVRVATGIDDQNRITSVIANMRLANLDTVSFKAISGWVTLTLAELEGVAAAIAAHVQACFTAERAHHEAIDALQQLYAEDDQALQQALEGYDLEQGWPASASANQ